MRAKSQWKAWLDAANRQAAERVVRRIATRLGAELLDLAIEPYPKGGFVASWCVAHDATFAEALIIEAIRSGQMIATGWQLIGTIDQDPSAIASVAARSHIAVAGVTMLEWALDLSSRSDP